MANVSSSNGLEKRPKLRFPGFDEPWKATAFGDLVHEFSNRTKVEDEDVLLSAAIEGMFLNTELFGHQRGASNKGYKKIKYGTMVLSTQNLHLGNANVNQRFEHGMVSPAYKTYDISGCSIDLMAQWIKSDAAKRFFYNATTVGASVCRRNVEWDTLYGQSLFLPSLPEQEKIANLLTLLSNRIEKQRHLIIALKKYKRGVSDYLFLQNSKMPIHCKWKQFSFGDVVEINPKTPPLPEQFIYIDLECVESGQLKSLNYINKNHAPSRAQRVLCRNDVLFQMVRPYQKNNYLYRDIFDVPVVASTGYAPIRCSECNPFFVYEQISSEQFSREAMMRSTGTGYPAINTDGLAQIPFYVPTPEEQEKIGVFLSALGAKIAKESEILAALDIVKKALMQQLFT